MNLSTYDLTIVHPPGFCSSSWLLFQSKLYDEEELAEKCLREIDMHTEEVLNSEGFLEVDHDTLQSLVVRDGLSIPEIRLFEVKKKVVC